MRIQLGKKKAGKVLREIEQPHKLDRRRRRHFKDRLHAQFAMYSEA